MLYAIESEAGVAVVFDVKSFPSWIDGVGVVDDEDYLRFVVEDSWGFKLLKLLSDDVIVAREVTDDDIKSDTIATVMRMRHEGDVRIFVHRSTDIADQVDDTVIFVFDKDSDRKAMLSIDVENREVVAITDDGSLVKDVEQHVGEAFRLLDMKDDEETIAYEMADQLFELLSKLFEE